MRARIIVVAAIVAMIAVACQPSSELRRYETVEAGTGLTVALEFEEPVVVGSDVGWDLEVVNPTAAPVTLTFDSGQRAEVVLDDASGNEAYRWGEDRAFTAAIEEVTIPAGERLLITLESDELDIARGDYELIAWVTATVEDRPLPRVRLQMAVTR